MSSHACITATGAYLPEKILSNYDLEKLVETSDSWIRKRTGIQERRIAEKLVTSDLAFHAAKRALEKRKIGPKEIDGIICATCSPDYLMPATANIVQKKLRALQGFAFDINGACSGFLYALISGASLIENRSAKKILIIGAEKMSAFVNYQDRSTCILFGDGAGAVLLESSSKKSISGFACDSIPEESDAITIPAGGSALPASPATVAKNKHTITMRGKDVFRLAIDTAPRVIAKTLALARTPLKEINWLIFHQANIKILKAICTRLQFPFEKCLVNIQKYGNTSAASIPIALTEAQEAGMLKPHDKILLCAFGAGLSFASCLIQWEASP